MIKLIQRILDERKARKREEYLNEWKVKESDLYKKMEYFRELARENESKAWSMYYNDMGGGDAYSAAASSYRSEFRKYEKELEKLGFEPENIYRGPLGDYDTPKGELGTENGNRGRKW